MDKGPIWLLDRGRWEEGTNWGGVGGAGSEEGKIENKKPACRRLRSGVLMLRRVMT